MNTKTVDDIREQLRTLSLDTRGNKTTIKERLRKYLKQRPELCSSSKRESEAGNDNVNNDRDDNKNVSIDWSDEESTTGSGTTTKPKELHPNSRYDYYLCFDVEATCETGFSFEFPNEVIEFPVVLLDGSTLEVVDEFQTYVRPTHRPILSDFCVELTGIRQETVDAAPTFAEMLVEFEEWLTKHGIILGEHPEAYKGLCHKGSKKTSHKNRSNAFQKNHQPKHSNNNNLKGNKHQDNFSSSSSSTLFAPVAHHGPTAMNDFLYGATFCFVCDGPFDVRDFIQKQCLHSDIVRPSYFAKPYLDIRTRFKDFFSLTTTLSLEGMLHFLGEEFQGRQHSGICDARMVALITKRLAQGFYKRPSSVKAAQQDTKAADQIKDEDKDTEEKEEQHREDDQVFRVENQEKISPQWSLEKVAKMSQGCVLKSNRVIDPSIPARMVPFYQLEGIDTTMMTPRTVPEKARTSETKDKHARKSNGGHSNSDSSKKDKVIESSPSNISNDDHTYSPSIATSDISSLQSIPTFPDNEDVETEDDELLIENSRFAALIAE
ncbi:hypothetical protein BGZ83_000574 [Gryganskiella cystojenkinii]|nr:hypothetical protein BGZ83_000574 [Gryganskiella cystojenkinii]